MKNSFEKFAQMAISKEGLKKFAGGLASTGASTMGSDTPVGIRCSYSNASTGESFEETGSCGSASEDACSYYGKSKYKSMGFSGSCYGT
jgi:hypothetical protein